MSASGVSDFDGHRVRDLPSNYNSGNDNETASQVYNVRIALLQRLSDADNLKIFFDAATLGGNDQLHKLLDSAEKSAIFLAIASPSYAKRE